MYAGEYLLPESVQRMINRNQLYSLNPFYAVQCTVMAEADATVNVRLLFSYICSDRDRLGFYAELQIVLFAASFKIFSQIFCTVAR